MKNNKKLYFTLFCIAIILLFVIIPLFLYLFSNGYFEEGIIGFTKYILIRIIWIIIIILLFINFLKKAKTNKLKYLKIIATITICLIMFFLLKTPILDIKFLLNPKKITLDNIIFEIDDIFENSTFYEIKGKNKENQYTFRINKTSLQSGKTMQKKNKDINATIYYLPNTKIVINVHYH